jgi:iron(III) transport system ATP-binding protein
MAQITIRNLTKRFKDVVAVNNLSLEIGDSQFVTLLGPSGCGKTTTLRMIAGFLEPDEGEIRVDGQLLSAPGRVVPPERRLMGMVFQNYAIWPHMTVFDNVAFGLTLRKVGREEARERVERMLDLVGLAGLGRRYPSQLSGGQQQRVALARSLVVEPSILLLDEPLSNLDAKLRERMRGELQQLQRRTGITFVYVTHDQAEALALSDRVALFHEGVLQQYAPPRDVYERPANLFVADFMGLVNKVDGQVVERSNGTARVALEGGPTLAAVVRQSSGPGAGAVTVAIRPEAIRLSATPPAQAENVLRGVVTQSTFLGNLLDYQVEVGGLCLRVQADRASHFDVGTPVYAAIPVEECVVM